MLLSEAGNILVDTLVLKQRAFALNSSAESEEQQN